MGLAIKDSGCLIRLMDRGDSNMRMAMFMMVSGEMTKLLGLVSTLIQMAQSMKATG